MGKVSGIISGGRYTDERGTIYFFNDFDMTEVKRFYRITNQYTSIIRAWRGHKIEQRWFNVCKGVFEIKLIEIDNFEEPSQSLKSITVILTAEEDSVLHVPAGFATSLRALSADSEVIVFADYGIEHARMDNYLYPEDYFKD